MGTTVLDVDFAFHQTWGPTALTSTDYDDTPDIVIPVEGLNTKVILLKNTGLDGLTYTILGSIDGGEEYDFTVDSDTSLASASQVLVNVTDYYTHLKIRLKMDTTDTVVVVKAAGQSI